MSWTCCKIINHYNDDIMSAMASPITNLTIAYSIVYSGTDQRKHQSSASLVFVRGIHRWPVNSPHKTPVTRKLIPFDNVIMYIRCLCQVRFIYCLVWWTIFRTIINWIRYYHYGFCKFVFNNYDPCDLRFFELNNNWFRHWLLAR